MEKLIIELNILYKLGFLNTHNYARCVEEYFKEVRDNYKLN